MKHIAKWLVILAAGILLTGCCGAEDGGLAGEDLEAKLLNRRFAVHQVGDRLSDKRIIVDTETGCCYLYFGYGFKYGAGMCQLTDRNGLPLIWEGYDVPD